MWSISVVDFRVPIKSSSSRCTSVPTTMPHISSDFTPAASLAGGVLVGTAATLYLACSGRLSGLSNIIRGELLNS